MIGIVDDGSSPATAATVSSRRRASRQAALERRAARAVQRRRTPRPARSRASCARRSSALDAMSAPAMSSSSSRTSTWRLRAASDITVSPVRSVSAKSSRSQRQALLGAVAARRSPAARSSGRSRASPRRPGGGPSPAPRSASSARRATWSDQYSATASEPSSRTRIGSSAGPIRSSASTSSATCASSTLPGVSANGAKPSAARQRMSSALDRARRGDGGLEGGARRRAAGARLRGAEAEQQARAARDVDIHPLERIERAREQLGGLLVGERVERAVGGPLGVVDRLGDVAARRGGEEVVGELGQMGLDRAAVDRLERLADDAMAAHAHRRPACRRRASRG